MNRLSAKPTGAVFLFFLIFFLSSGVSALAQGEGPNISLNIAASKEVRVQEEGQWVTKKAAFEKAQPGDVLVYDITYTNQGAAPAHNASIVDPVPGGTQYVPGSASGPGATILFSIDGGMRYQDYPAKYFVRTEDGKQRKKKPRPKCIPTSNGCQNNP